MKINNFDRPVNCLNSNRKEMTLHLIRLEKEVESLKTSR